MLLWAFCTKTMPTPEFKCTCFRLPNYFYFVSHANWAGYFFRLQFRLAYKLRIFRFHFYFTILKRKLLCFLFDFFNIRRRLIQRNLGWCLFLLFHFLIFYHPTPFSHTHSILDYNVYPPIQEQINHINMSLPCCLIYRNFSRLCITISIRTGEGKRPMEAEG